MQEQNKLKEYKTEDLIVYWDYSICSHVGKCTAAMPHVFSPEKRPWVCLEGADPLEVIRTIDTCPTGALKYQLPEGSSIDPEMAKGPNWIEYRVSKPVEVRIRVVKDGPLTVKGPARLLGEDGELIQESESMVLCRCGKTKKPPFCDGAHRD